METVKMNKHRTRLIGWVHNSIRSDEEGCFIREAIMVRD